MHGTVVLPVCRLDIMKDGVSAWNLHPSNDITHNTHTTGVVSTLIALPSPWLTHAALLLLRVSCRGSYLQHNPQVCVRVTPACNKLNTFCVCM
jgi:hypothetical protein